jgi:hypothetical protein
MNSCAAICLARFWRIRGAPVARRTDPVRSTLDPISEIQKAFRRYVGEDIDSGNWRYGCPLNNLAQEMGIRFP